MEQDKRSMIAGMVETARILASAGATKLSTLHCDGFEIESLSSQKLTDSDIDRFEAQVGKRGIVPNKISLFSAHIMGTARMGKAGISFCDDNAESYQVSGLFIGDASVFPTSLGIIPLITIGSFGKRKARRVEKFL